MKTKSAPMIGRYWRMRCSPMVSATSPRSNDDDHLEEVLDAARAARGRTGARPAGKRMAIRAARSSAMMAASGIQAALPSGKKKSAIPGESLLHGRLAQEAGSTGALIGPVEDRMMLAARAPTSSTRSSGTTARTTTDSPRHAGHRIETLPPQENRSREARSSDGRHQQKGEQGSQSCLACAGDRDARSLFEDQKAENNDGRADCQGSRRRASRTGQRREHADRSRCRRPAAGPAG